MTGNLLTSGYKHKEQGKMMTLFSIERNQGTAAYAQVARILETEFINNGMPGDRLPSESRLAEQFVVNRHTLRRAMDEIISAAMVERFHGVGIFVSEKQIDCKLQSKTRFTQTLHDLGMSTNCVVVKNAVIEAPKVITDALGMQPRSNVLWIETLRYADEVPLCLISHFLPYTPFGEPLSNYQGGSLHEVLTLSQAWPIPHKAHSYHHFIDCQEQEDKENGGRKMNTIRGREFSAARFGAATATPTW